MTARSPAIGLRSEMVDQLFRESLHATVARGLPASFVVSTTYLAPFDQIQLLRLVGHGPERGLWFDHWWRGMHRRRYCVDDFLPEREKTTEAVSSLRGEKPSLIHEYAIGRDLLTSSPFTPQGKANRGVAGSVCSGFWKPHLTSGPRGNYSVIDANSWHSSVRFLEGNWRGRASVAGRRQTADG